MPITPMTAADLDAVEQQLGRRPRGVVGCAYRCSCGTPLVVATAPVLDDGSPFPTTYYLTCQRLAAEISRREASGLMQEMTARLTADPELAERYQQAHESYLADRKRLAAELDLPVPDAIATTTAGGMPLRVKCLHALTGHALAVGPGVNPFGDEVVADLGDWFAQPCAHQRQS
ncbi:MAG: DUF501 domain-containing protein [Propionibacteriaceae bacterium]